MESIAAVTIPDEFLDLMAEKFRMLADPSRLAILRVLMAGERNVTGIVEETGRSQANVSKHLKMLADAGLVERRKQGLQVFYRVGDPLVQRLCELVCETIVREAKRDVESRAKLLEGWRAESTRMVPRREEPSRKGDATVQAPAGGDSSRRSTERRRENIP